MPSSPATLDTRHSALARSPAQRFLPIRVDLRLPTVDLAGARAITGRHENELKDLVDTGELLWVWDISRAGQGKRELRFLAKELRWFGTDSAIHGLDEPTVVALLYGPARPFILGKHFHRAWNCDSGHMCNLVADNTLGIVKGTSYGQGRGNTPCITWTSALDFLQTRRLP